MKKHVLSKKCWCKPDVISFRKDKEDILSDKVFEIASLFNDSMDNDKYNKIRKILKSAQMETEVETGLKNFQVTMKELADARREVIKDKIDRVKLYEVIESIYLSGMYRHDQRVLRQYMSDIINVLATLKEGGDEK